MIDLFVLDIEIIIHIISMYQYYTWTGNGITTFIVGFDYIPFGYKLWAITDWINFLFEENLSIYFQYILLSPLFYHIDEA